MRTCFIAAPGHFAGSSMQNNGKKQRFINCWCTVSMFSPRCVLRSS